MSDTKKPFPMLTATAPDWSWYEFKIQDQIVRVTRQEALEAELPVELNGAPPITRARRVALERAGLNV